MITRSQYAAKLEDRLLYCLAGLIFSGLIFTITNSIPPSWDTLHYVGMAEQGLAKNDNLVAPFAYRWAVPLILGLVAEHLGIEVAGIYRGAAFLTSTLFFVLVVMIAEFFVRSRVEALLVGCIVASGFWFAKFGAFLDTMLDIYSFALVCLGWLFLLSNRLWAAALVGILGLFVKEWSGVIVALTAIVSFLNFLRDRHIRDAWLTLAVLLGGTIAIVVPRLLIEVASTEQFLDPYNDSNWASVLTEVLGNKKRLFNVGVANLSFWLPLLLLFTVDRCKALLGQLREQKLLMLCIVHVVLVQILTLYGGTNIPIFVSYSAPVLAIGVAIALSRGVGTLEVALVLGATLFYNRIFLHVPDPRVNMEAYLTYFAGYGNRISDATFLRLAEMLVLFVAIKAILWAVQRLGAARAS